MKKNETPKNDPLQHVNPQRRQFLAKLIAGGVALPVMSSIALAQPGEGKGKGKGDGKGKGAPDPAEFAARLMKEFDKDGDKALNLEELTAALKAMRERRGMQGGKGKGKGDAGKGKGEGKGKGDGKGKGKGKGDGKGKGGGGKGKGKGDGKGKGKGDAQPGGGVRPKRPESN